MSDVTETIDENTLIANFEDVEMLRRSIIDANQSDSTVPDLLFVIIKQGSWRHRLDPVTGEDITLTAKQFRDFITDAPRRGLGQDFEAMKERFCKTQDLVDEWDLATVGKQGSDGQSNNPHGRAGKPKPAPQETNPNNVRVSSEPRAGNDPQYALRRLRKDRPDLHALVLSGELSPHRAMVTAGFRDPSVSLPLVPEKAARILRKHFTTDQLELIFALVLPVGDAVR